MDDTAFSHAGGPAHPAECPNTEPPERPEKPLPERPDQAPEDQPLTVPQETPVVAETQPGPPPTEFPEERGG